MHQMQGVIYVQPAEQGGPFTTSTATLPRRHLKGPATNKEQPCARADGIHPHHAERGS